MPLHCGIEALVRALSYDVGVTRKRLTGKSRRAIAAVAAAVAFLAAVEGAAGVVSYVVSWTKDVVTPDAKPTRAERIVPRFVRETKRIMPWQQPPTIFAPSVTYFRRHFRALDPERTHPVSIANVKAVVDVPTIAERPANLQGNLIAVRGLLGDKKEAAAYGSVTSWAYMLYHRVRDRAIVVCRAPEETRAERRLEFGKPVYAIGVLLAEGSTMGKDGKPIHTLYMVCSALGVTSRITLPLPGRGYQTRPPHGGSQP